MKVLIVGHGAREHALAWACARDSAVEQVFVVPGNPGTAEEPGVINRKINGRKALIDFALQQQIDLILIGPEQPIVEGLGDSLRQAGLCCLAPSARAAQLEGSKSFAKDFMRRKGIPTADFAVFESPDEAREWVRKRNIPVAIKADGLAGGKGVVLARSLPEAEAAIDWLGRNFQQAGKKLVVEELLVGREASFIVLADGKNAMALATSEDHKARDDGDQGPNTGGMGAISPSAIIDEALHRKIMAEIVQPTMAGMAEEGSAFVGFLYVGLMITPEGEPRVLEFNCRLGDPEAQVLLYRHGDGFARLCAAAAAGRLPPEDTCNWSDETAVTVVMAAEGYPQNPRSGDVITGLEALPADTRVFHGGTAMDRGQLVTAGGRVLSITAAGASASQARTRAYAAVQKVRWRGAFWRSDIGDRR